jgi:PAS domain S-box-containing protein
VPSPITGDRSSSACEHLVERGGRKQALGPPLELLGRGGADPLARLARQGPEAPSEQLEQQRGFALNAALLEGWLSYWIRERVRGDIVTSPTYDELTQRVAELEQRIKMLEERGDPLPAASDASRVLVQYAPLLLEKIFEKLLVIGTDFRIVDANTAAIRTYGGAKQGVLGGRCYEVTHGVREPCTAAEHPCPVRQVLATGQPACVEHVHQSAEGHEVHVEILAFPIRAADGSTEYVVEMQNDITDRKRADRARIEREKLEAVIEMAGAVCHQLNQPLQLVAMSAQLAEQRLGRDHATSKLLKNIVEGTHRMVEVSRKLQYIIRYETTEYALGVRIVDLERSSGAPESDGLGDDSQPTGRGEEPPADVAEP